MTRRLALTLSLAALALPALAQTPAAPAADVAPAAAPAPAPAPDKLTVDVGGWAVFNTFANFGGSNATDLPQRAAAFRDEVAFGMQVRQSRLRTVLGLPSDGLLGGAKLKGLVELDFMGGAVGGDQSLPLVRFRHGWVSATWKDLGNLELLVGQTWGIYAGPYFAQSLGHLAVPRFGGAGFLFRRAPQVRVSGDVGGDVFVRYQVGVMSNMDKGTAPVVASGALVGERSGIPDGEARLAVIYREGKKQVAEVAVSGHYGQDRYALTQAPGGATTPSFLRNKTVDSSGVAVDAKVEVGPVTVLGAAFQGQNLDILNTSPGVRSFTTAVAGAAAGTTTLDNVAAIHTQGYWAQLQFTPVAGLQLVAGGGMETPKAKDLAPGGSVMRKNGQWSAGAIVNLTAKWRASAEFTHYVTNYNAAGARFMLDQAELSTLYAF